MSMAAMGMVAAGVFLGVGYLNKKCPQGFPGLVFHKNPVFEVRLPKLDQLTVHLHINYTIIHILQLLEFLLCCA